MQGNYLQSTLLDFQKGLQGKLEILKGKGHFDESKKKKKSSNKMITETVLGCYWLERSHYSLI